MKRPTEMQRQAWMAQWRSAAIALSQVRLAELGSVDLARVAADLDDASREVVRARGSAVTSGLVVQQRLFHSRRPS